MVALQIIVFSAISCFLATVGSVPIDEDVIPLREAAPRDAENDLVPREDHWELVLFSNDESCSHDTRHLTTQKDWFDDDGGCADLNFNVSSAYFNDSGPGLCAMAFSDAACTQGLWKVTENKQCSGGTPSRYIKISYDCPTNFPRSLGEGDVVGEPTAQGEVDPHVANPNLVPRELDWQLELYQGDNYSCGGNLVSQQTTYPQYPENTCVDLGTVADAGQFAYAGPGLCATIYEDSSCLNHLFQIINTDQCYYGLAGQYVWISYNCGENPSISARQLASRDPNTALESRQTQPWQAASQITLFGSGLGENNCSSHELDLGIEHPQFPEEECIDIGTAFHSGLFNNGGAGICATAYYDRFCTVPVFVITNINQCHGDFSAQYIMVSYDCPTNTTGPIDLSSDIMGRGDSSGHALGGRSGEVLGESGPLVSRGEQPWQPRRDLEHHEENMSEALELPDAMVTPHPEVVPRDPDVTFAPEPTNQSPPGSASPLFELNLIPDNDDCDMSPNGFTVTSDYLTLNNCSGISMTISSAMFVSGGSDFCAFAYGDATCTQPIWGISQTNNQCSHGTPSIYWKVTDDCSDKVASRSIEGDPDAAAEDQGD